MFGKIQRITYLQTLSAMSVSLLYWRAKKQTQNSMYGLTIDEQRGKRSKVKNGAKEERKEGEWKELKRENGKKNKNEKKEKREKRGSLLQIYQFHS
ncbi:hypothetical protein DUI87_06977 [Hirundo rustica rustica]|uniref:Uncharacterized protein n=1 Tax=Hirundo rustica rustica TaxID=333673 RepID=A0A3M0KQC5_HIRRU|nr:hypothetical protein DUI87_06977 [Hirundo rustica rustica]